MKTNDFDYELPESYIAQSPAIPRDSCKLLTLNKNGQIEHNIFRDIGKFLQAGDLLVVNETRVLPARLFGQKQTGAKVETLLLDKVKNAPDSADEQTWNCMVRPGKRLKIGAIIEYFDNVGVPPSGADSDIGEHLDELPNNIDEHPDCADSGADEHLANKTPILQGEVIGIDESNGSRSIHFTLPAQTKQAQAQNQQAQAQQQEAQVQNEQGQHQQNLYPKSVDEAIHRIGHTPLPPYIKNYAGDEELYQTVYAKNENSAAAPTAGLHFTESLIEQLKASGVRFANVDLEVGLDTFRLVEEDDPKDHAMHTELYSVPAATVDAIKETKRAGKRVIAVGTTSVRSLESAARSGQLESCTRQATDLFILPGYEFKVVDAIITNFHVPRSTLMMLVSAFSGRENIMNAYECAKKEGYRFFSFGDAMLLL